MALTIIQGKVEKEQGIYYEVDANAKPLGEGGMGKVYAGVCVNEKTGARNDVAIKFLYEDLDENALRHARREASIQLHNDNLIEMYGFSEVEEENVLGEKVKHYHIASELLNGISLADFLDGKLKGITGEEIQMATEMYAQFQEDPESFAVRIIRNVLSGLLALHDAGYIHRDIDPTNIMLTNDGRIKIIDLGIAKKVNDLGSKDKAMTVSGIFIGKPEYAAPELVLGDIKHQNATTDIYAVGILLYQCIVGQVPFKGPHHEVLEMQLRKNLPLRNIKNSKLRAIIAKATNKNQAKRYRSVAEFRAALDALSQNIKPEPSFINKFIWLIAIVTGLILGVLIGLL